MVCIIDIGVVGSMKLFRFPGPCLLGLIGKLFVLFVCFYPLRCRLVVDRYVEVKNVNWTSASGRPILTSLFGRGPYSYSPGSE